MSSPIEESATGDVDGVNTAFTTSSDYKPGSLQVFVNGIFGGDVTELGGKDFELLGGAPLPGDTVAVYYLPI